MLQIGNSGTFVWVTRLDKKIVDRLRKQFHDEGCSLSLSLDYDTHHKIPLSLSGDNSRENLVMMERSDHAYLHREFLDPQTRDLRAGESGWLVVPTTYDMESKTFKQYEKLIEDLLSDKLVIYKVKER